MRIGRNLKELIIILERIYKLVMNEFSQVKRICRLFCDFGIEITTIFSSDLTILCENFVLIWEYLLYILVPT